jgi:hypothetical protein
MCYQSWFWRWFFNELRLFTSCFGFFNILLNQLINVLAYPHKFFFNFFKNEMRITFFSHLVLKFEFSPSEFLCFVSSNVYFFFFVGGLEGSRYLFPVAPEKNEMLDVISSATTKNRLYRLFLLVLGIS